MENERWPHLSQAMEGHPALQEPAIRIRFVHVPVPNIAVARNAAVRVAEGKWIAFLDDDEYPDEGWLSHLVGCGVLYSADCVCGPIVAEFPASAPVWLRESGVYERPRFASGTRLNGKQLRTGNVLIDSDVLGPLVGPFDAAYGKSGGEDTALFTCLERLGARLIWCDEARVTEVLVPERTTFSSVCGRALSSAGVYSTLLIKEKGVVGRVMVGCRGGASAIIYGSATALVLLMSRGLAVRYWLRAVAGVGKLFAALGLQYERFGERWRWCGERYRRHVKS